MLVYVICDFCFPLYARVVDFVSRMQKGCVAAGCLAYAEGVGEPKSVFSAGADSTLVPRPSSTTSSLLFSGIDGETQQFIYPLPPMPFSPRELKIGTELSGIKHKKQAFLEIDPYNPGEGVLRPGATSSWSCSSSAAGDRRINSSFRARAWSTGVGRTKNPLGKTAFLQLLGDASRPSAATQAGGDFSAGSRSTLASSTTSSSGLFRGGGWTGFQMDRSSSRSSVKDALRRGSTSRRKRTSFYLDCIEIKEQDDGAPYPDNPYINPPVSPKNGILKTSKFENELTSWRSDQDPESQKLGYDPYKVDVRSICTYMERKFRDEFRMAPRAKVVSPETCGSNRLILVNDRAGLNLWYKCCLMRQKSGWFDNKKP